MMPLYELAFHSPEADDIRLTDVAPKDGVVVAVDGSNWRIGEDEPADSWVDAPRYEFHPVSPSIS